MTRRKKKPTASPPEPAASELDAGTEIDAREVSPAEPDGPTAPVEELVQAAATVVKRRRARKAPETEAERNAAAIERARAAIVDAADADERAPEPMAEPVPLDDVETTVNLVGDELTLPGRDDLDPPTLSVPGDQLEGIEAAVGQRQRLRGLLEALVFASDVPVKTTDLVTVAEASFRQVKDALEELVTDYSERGIHLEEVNGGWVFRTSAKFAPYVRDLTKQRPVRLSRAQVEALAIIAYRQPITRPEIDDVRGVDSGPVLKVLLERDLVRILGKRDEVGRPLIYGTTNAFLEFFGLKSLKDLPTLREFTELTEESRETYEDEMGEPPNEQPPSDDSEEPAQDGTTESADDDDADDDE